MRILIVILFLFPAWLFSQTISSVNPDGSIIVQMPDGTKYPYIKQKYSPSDTPLWVADYGSNSQTSSLETVIIPDSLKFLNNGYIQFNGIGVLKSGDVLNNCSIEMGNLGTMYISSHNTVNGVNYDVTEMISGENQSVNWSLNDLCRYQIDKSGFHPTEYTSNLDQWLGTQTFPWNGVCVNRNFYFYNVQAVSGIKMIAIDGTGKVGTMPFPTTGNQQNVPLDTIFCTQGIIVWNETGTTNKEVMISFENVSTQYTSFYFPIPLSRYYKYGDSNITGNQDISPTGEYFKAEHLNNVTGFLFLKGY